MLSAIKQLLGMGPKVDLSEMVRNGAVIVDVRTKGEFAGGHIRGAVNIPLDQLPNQLGKLKNKQTPVITCCASGMRSSAAKGILQRAGYTTVVNGGGWMSLSNKLNK